MWIDMHPGWDVKLWSKEANEQLMREDYPWFYPTWAALPREIIKLDAVRYFYLHKYGGVYVDLDTEPLKPMGELFATAGHGSGPTGYNSTAPPIIFAFLSGANAGHTDNVPNGWMAAAPGHPFFLRAAVEVAKRAATANAGTLRVEDVAGPAALTALVNDWFDEHHELGRKALQSPKQRQRADDLLVVEAGAIYPYDWTLAEHRAFAPECSARADTFDPAKCKTHFPDAYTITYYSHTWEGPTNTVIERKESDAGKGRS